MKPTSVQWHHHFSMLKFLWLVSCCCDTGPVRVHTLHLVVNSFNIFQSITFHQPPWIFIKLNHVCFQGSSSKSYSARLILLIVFLWFHLGQTFLARREDGCLCLSASVSYQSTFCRAAGNSLGNAKLDHVAKWCRWIAPLETAGWKCFLSIHSCYCNLPITCNKRPWLKLL